MDPEFVAVRDSVFDLRQHFSLDLAGPSLDREAARHCPACPGPMKAFLHRAHRLGWAWNIQSQCMQDLISPFSIWDCSPQELHLRLEIAWQKVVAATVGTRKGFEGLRSADPQATKASYKHLKPEAQKSIRCLLNGTHFTADVACHFEDGLSNRCRFCGEVDSLEHRILECSYFGEDRQRSGFNNLRPRSLAAAQSLHGWAHVPASLHAFRGYLSGLPPPPRQALDLGDLDMFTDGACLCPQQPLARLASGPSFTGFWLPSLCMFRAELSAVAHVLQVAAGSTKPFRIWTDCLGVVRKVRTLQTVAHPPNAMASNGDLWLQVWMSIQLLEVSFDPYFGAPGTFSLTELPPQPRLEQRGPVFRHARRIPTPAPEVWCYTLSASQQRSRTARHPKLSLPQSWLECSTTQNLTTFPVPSRTGWRARQG